MVFCFILITFFWFSFVINMFRLTWIRNAKLTLFLKEDSDLIFHNCFSQNILCKEVNMRQYDVVVWGSTGFIGKLICSYLRDTYPTLKWAMAARSMDSLIGLQKSLKIGDNVGKIVASLNDESSMSDMASKTRVLIAAVGPFGKLGKPAVKACVEAETHYCDLAGELPWLRNIIDEFGDKATMRKLKIVNLCGFDCIPSDLGVQMIVNELHARGASAREVRFTAYDFKGSLSGGTLYSMMDMMETSSMKTLRAMASPYYLNPLDKEGNRPVRPTNDKAVISLASDKKVFDYDTILKCWNVPYLMQTIDTRLINRTNALLNFKYGTHFAFTERMTVASFIHAVIITAMTPIMLMFLITPIGRYILKMILPKPGKGPSQELLDNGYMHLKLWGRGIDDKTGKDVLVTGGVSAVHGDPGYSCLYDGGDIIYLLSLSCNNINKQHHRQAAKMISEAAICLALDSELLPTTFGVLTPATAMGSILRERLRKQGVDFYIDNDSQEVCKKKLNERPLLTKAVSSTVVGALGDTLCQYIQLNKDSNLTFSYRRVLVFATVCGVYVAPVLHTFYNLLEDITLPHSINTKLGRALIMTALSQIVFTPFSITGFFFAFELVTRLYPPYVETENIWHRLRAGFCAGYDATLKKLCQTLKINYLIWPAISFINFMWVPLPYRVLFVNCFQVMWNVILSQIANKEVHSSTQGSNHVSEGEIDDESERLSINGNTYASN